MSSGHRMHLRKQNGSAIIMLFIAVALFGLLSYAFLQGSGSNLNMITDEGDKAIATQFQDCENTVQLTMKRLRTRGSPKSSAVRSGRQPLDVGP